MNELLTGVAVDVDYVQLLGKINTEGNSKTSRTGVNTTSIFGHSTRFNLRNGRVPIHLIKRLPVEKMKHELFWFLRGDTTIKYLKEHDVNIWDSWVDPATKVYAKNEDGTDNLDVLVDGNLPQIYQHQWFKWEDIKVSHGAPLDGYEIIAHDKEKDIYTNRREINQVQQMIDTLRNDPDCRRMKVSAWNVAKINDMALPACHYEFNAYSTVIDNLDRLHIAIDDKVWLEHPLLKHLTREEMEGAANDTEEKLAELLDMLKIPKRTLSMSFSLRSSDAGVGISWNIAEYGMLAHIIGKMTDHYPIELIYRGDDVHVYQDQWDYVSATGVPGGIGEIFARWNDLVSDETPTMVNTPEEDTYIAVMEDGTELELSAARIKLSDKFIGMNTDGFQTLVSEDLVISNYKPLPTVPFPKAAV